MDLTKMNSTFPFSEPVPQLIFLLFYLQTQSFRITIKNLKKKDEGNYTCRVENDEGSLSWTFELKVKETTG